MANILSSSRIAAAAASLIISSALFASAPDRTGILARYDRLPLSFEENRGQADESVKFLSRGRGYALLLGANETVLRLAADTVRMRFQGASVAPRLAGLDPQAGRVNYLVGNDSGKWLKDVATFARVEYRDLYPGISLVYYGNQHQLEYDLVIAAHADPRAIRMSFDGIQSLAVGPQGDLILKTAAGEIRQSRPLVYQETNGVRQELQGRYVVTGPREAGFQVDGYDAAKPLVIDPVLNWASYLGGGGDDTIWAVAVDASGSAYVAGESRAATTGDTFPITTGVKPLLGIDAFVTKFSADGKTLVYSTYVGGNNDDEAYAIAVDSAGNAYIGGATLSTNFPTTNGAKTTFGGGTIFGDGFVTKLNPAGNTVLYSTYLGGGDEDAVNAIAVDSTGNVYAAGGTLSTNFPTSGGSPFTGGVSAYQSANAGPAGTRDVFVTKLNPGASGAASLLYSTYLGGKGDDSAYGIAVDSSGVYVTGYTQSSNFPVTAKAYKNTLTNPSCTTSTLPATPCDDVFVAKVDPTAPATTGLVYSTYLGGTGDQTAYSMVVDSSGNAIVAGETYSTDFPVTSAAYQNKAFGGTCVDHPCYDGFVTKLSPDGSSLVYSTYLGGSGDDSIFTIAGDTSGNVYVAGQTSSKNFPTSTGLLQSLGGGYDAFLTKLNLSASGSAGLVSSTYLGGFGDDWANGVAVDSSGKAYVAGVAESINFPVTSGAYKMAFGSCDSQLGCDRGFVASLSFSPEVAAGPRVLLNGYVNAASFGAAPVSPGDMVTIFGQGIGPSTLTTAQLDSSGNVASTLAQTQVLFDGVAAPLIYVSSGQITAMVPYDVATKTVSQMQISFQGTKSNTLVLPVMASDLSVFTISADGKSSGTGTGQAAVINQDGSINSATNAAARNSFIQVYLTGAGQTTPAGVNGKLVSGTTVKIAQPVTATIGGIPATVQYAGGAPGGVAGFMQVNLQIPSSAPTGGAVPLQINLGNPVTDSTQDGLTIAVK